MFSLKDAVAVVSGAGGGIGGALALSLARCGCHLALTDIKAQPLAVAAAAAIAAFAAAVVAEYGKLSVLVNRAGVGLAGLFRQCSDEEIEWLFEINFWSVVRMTKAFQPILEREP